MFDFDDADERVGEVVFLAGETFRAYRSLRYGQALFNVAYSLYPECVRRMQESTKWKDIDPFQDDDKADGFCDELRTQILLKSDDSSSPENAE